MSDQFIYDFTDTWDDGAVTWNAMRVSVTDTASAVASRAISISINGDEKFGVRKDGRTLFKSADFDGFATSRARVIPALEINCGTGNYFTKSISANSTFTFASVPSDVYSMTVKVTTSGAQTITWPAAVRWPNAQPPALTAARTHLFHFLTDDGGTTWYGSAVPNYT